jgi:hypothetical protein
VQTQALAPAFAVGHGEDFAVGSGRWAKRLQLAGLSETVIALIDNYKHNKMCTVAFNQKFKDDSFVVHWANAILTPRKKEEREEGSLSSYRVV